MQSSQDLSRRSGSVAERERERDRYPKLVANEGQLLRRASVSGVVDAEYFSPYPLPDGTTDIESQKTSLPLSTIDGASQECYVLLILHSRCSWSCKSFGQKSSVLVTHSH